MSRKLEILKRLIGCWQAGDIEGALGFMTDDIIWHYAAAVAPAVRGKDKARKFLTGFKARIREVDWRIFDWAERGERLFVEGVDQYLSAEGGRVCAPYAGVLEFRGELICAWRDYVDVGVLSAQERGEPRSAWVAALVERPAL